MAHLLQRAHDEIRTRRDRQERVHAIANAQTPAHRHELEAIFQMVDDCTATRT